MSRGGLAAILISLVMVMVGAVPIMAGTYEVVKGSQGPNSSAVTWTYVAQDYCVWTAHIVNNGLKSLTIEVCDNTTGVPQEIMHQRIRFAAYDAYPIGVVESQGAIMAAGRIYVITATPSGPRGASCTITDSYPPPPPVAMFEIVLSPPVAWFDASGSYDPLGTVISYSWEFGDGDIGSGIYINHKYAGPGTYTVTLTVTNEAGSKASATKEITISDKAPVASFTYSVIGNTVAVDASPSSDDFGIVSCEWDWGDGTTGTGVTATHTYSIPSATAPEPQPNDRRGTGMFLIFGMTRDANDNILPDCLVVVTNLRTGACVQMASGPEGYYEWMISGLPGGVLSGDVINVTALKDGWFGQNEAPVDFEVGFLWLDVKLYQGVSQPWFTVTLKVTDTANQIGTTSRTVVPGEPLKADFISSTSWLTVTCDASISSGQVRIVTYTWDWGDGSLLDMTSGPYCWHAYSAYDTYSVTLTVTDTSGNTASISRLVLVNSPEPP